MLITGCFSIRGKPDSPRVSANLNLQEAIWQVADDLARQLDYRPTGQALTIDPILDRATGQQTSTSAQVEQELSRALQLTLKGTRQIPFDSEGVDRANLVLTGTIAALDATGQHALSVAITDRQSGFVTAQSAARFGQAGLDATPTAFYRDSPSLVRDRSVDGYLRTATTPAGQLADPLYVEQLSTSALLAEALRAYNGGQWESALAGYDAASRRPDGQQLRTFNGIYLANLRLSRLDAAEEAFGQIAALGLATNNLAIKLLFRVNSSNEFWPGPDLGDMYPLWLRRIAYAAQASGTCLSIVGHTSHSGSPDYNERLSRERAETVQRMLEGQAPGLIGKLRASGVGFSENIIGTGADDASDAADRRVDFAVVPCAGER